jgi:hypothetical protein
MKGSDVDPKQYNLKIEVTCDGKAQTWLHDYIRDKVRKMLEPKPRVTVTPGYLILGRVPSGTSVVYRWRRGLRWLPVGLLKPFFVQPFSRLLCETVITEHG